MFCLFRPSSRQRKPGYPHGFRGRRQKHDRHFCRCRDWGDFPAAFASPLPLEGVLLHCRPFPDSSHHPRPVFPNPMGSSDNVGFVRDYSGGAVLTTILDSIIGGGLRVPGHWQPMSHAGGANYSVVPTTIPGGRIDVKCVTPLPKGGCPPLSSTATTPFRGGASDENSRATCPGAWKKHETDRSRWTSRSAGRFRPVEGPN